MSNPTILALSGSLRSGSTNSRLIDRFAELAPPGVVVDVYRDLERIPPFNPDHEQTPHADRDAFVERVRRADALVVSTPEYAHGFPGVLKNALDWIVGTDAFVAKPFTLLRATPRSVHAPAMLIEVLSTMSGLYLEAADVTIDLGRGFGDADVILASDATREQLEQTMGVVAARLRQDA
ncbi:MAG: NADPH-dependent FMN reductase [Gemmatimonadota bacterium]